MLNFTNFKMNNMHFIDGLANENQEKADILNSIPIVRYLTVKWSQISIAIFKKPRIVRTP